MTRLHLTGLGRSSASGEEVEQLQWAQWLDGAIVFDRRRWKCDSLDLEWRNDAHLIVVTEAGHTRETNVRINSDAYRGRDRAGAVSFVPAMATRLASYREANLVFSALWIDPSLVENLCGARRDALGAVLNGRDELVQQLMGSLTSVLARTGQVDTAYVEHLSALAFLRLAAGRADASLQHRGRTVSTRQLAKIEAFVDENLGRDIALSELATQTGMPVSSFSRAFTATTGMTPYAYVLERRVERAKTSLALRDQPLAAIAFLCGFSSQSHFTSVFRKKTGMPPGAYRSHFPGRI